MNHKATWWARASAATAALVFAGVAHAERQLNMKLPVTQAGQTMYDLHTLMLVICAVIFVGVFGVMFYSLYAHRKSVNKNVATFHESHLVEVVWTVIPFVILLVMAFPATKAIIAMRDTSNPDLTIKVTGYQWKWGYDYLKGEGEGVRLVSNLSTPQDQIFDRTAKGENYLLEVDNPLVVPVGKKVRILTTADDVIHAWYVPELAVQQDATPGFIRDTWFKAEKVGTYRGQCAKLCGKDHAYMPIVVNVVSEADYAKWVGEQKKKMAAAGDNPDKTWTVPELVARGEKAFAANCAACHQANGRGLPPAFPSLVGSKVVTGPVAGHVDILLNGRAGTAMASFKQLSDVELAALVAYTRQSWGNKVDEIVQPADIKAIREGGKPGKQAAAKANGAAS
ncbi:MAG: cytochrome c oxidase, subunit [Pseudomonadota bacterium]